MVGIVEAVVMIVVAGGGRDGCDAIEVVQLCQGAKVCLLDQHVHHLCNIGTVQVIVIGHVLPVPFIYSAQKIYQFVITDHDS